MKVRFLAVSNDQKSIVVASIMQKLIVAASKRQKLIVAGVEKLHKISLVTPRLIGNTHKILDIKVFFSYS